MKLKMLQPRLATLDPFQNVKMLDTKKKPWLKLSDIKTARWTKAKNGRLLPLNSAAWHKLRASVLASEPLCRLCAAQGLTVVATCVDHIDNNPANNDPSNLQPLDHECHSRKTAKDMGHNVRMGCDTSGMPLDQGHHWNKPATTVLVAPVGAVVERSPATDGHEPISIPSVNAIC
jgi:5-methylcytosine-specific restriction protein A